MFVQQKLELISGAIKGDGGVGVMTTNGDFWGLMGNKKSWGLGVKSLT